LERQGWSASVDGTPPGPLRAAGGVSGRCAGRRSGVGPELPRRIASGRALTVVVDRFARTLGPLSLPIAQRRTTLARLMEDVLGLVAKVVGELPHHLHGSRQSCLIDARGCHDLVGRRQARGDDSQ
jgi:hypothetical protein